MSLLLNVAFVTHRGPGKNGLNQDALLVDGQCYAGISMEQAESLTYHTSKPGLLAISDGVGSAPHAHKASEKVLTFLRDTLKEEAPFSPTRVIRNIQNRMENLAMEKPRFRGMAATLAALYIERREAIAFNTGDSRIYLMRGEKLKRLSRDHTQLQRMLDHGEISAEKAEGLSDIYSALEGYLVAGELEEEALPVEVSRLELRQRDLLLLCSDGVSDLVSDHEMEEILSMKEDALTKCKRLFRTAYASGVDDLSIIVAEVL
jgi:protein phosphatase